MEERATSRYVTASDGASLAYVTAGTGPLDLLWLAPSRIADPGFRDRLARCERLGLSPEDTADSLRMAFELDLRSLLGGIRVPTLVLHRKDDAFVRVEAGRYLAEHIPGARYVELDGSDYLFVAGDTDALIAKRICDLAGPGEVLVSRPVVDLTSGAGIEFSARGEHDLKGVPGSWSLFGVAG